MSETIRSVGMDPEGMKGNLVDFKVEPDVEQGLCRRDKLGQTVADNVSPESNKVIESLVDQVAALNPIERLLLYLKLPAKSQPGQEVDPLRQPINPLGSRTEITITINWIRTHLEEDPQVSLPKHEVYDEYLGYCQCNTVKPLSTADFGKVMKQVYPQVRPRRLGTRGNSRYCYAGLRKRIKLDTPATPDISSDGRGGGDARDSEEELGSAASFLIREWVEKLLGVKFENLTELALHLLDKMYVDNRSSAAFTLLSTVSRVPPLTVNPQQLDTKPQISPLSTPRSLVDPKRKLSTEPDLVNGKRAKSEPETPRFQPDPPRFQPEPPRFQPDPPRFQPDPPRFLPDPPRIQPDPPDLVLPVSCVGYNSDTSLTNPPIYSRINLNPRPPSSISIDKLPRKKQALAQVCIDGSILVSSLKTEDNKQYKEEGWLDEPIQEKLKSEVWPNDEPADLTTHQFYVSTDKLGSGGSSSDAQEEELARYFTEPENGTVQSAEHKKISQLRELLQKNLKSPSGGSPLGGGAFKRTSLPLRDINKVENNVSVSSTVESLPTLSNRRRVSFNPLTVCEGVSSVPTSSCPVPPSPGTRRRHYSFQPISPKSGALQSPPASPFVSPRSTPVHMLRSRHSSGSALPVHLLPGGGRNHHASGCSDVSRAATYGSASESSTPFISPQGTPIPFNRSRHNSAQPRLCRSRHSSGLSLPTQYANNIQHRFNTMPYSPGALSNLNNPFSPQPSTPLQCTDQEPLYSQVGPGNQFAAVVAEDPRSRHSSAGSDQAPRSAPLSPYNPGPTQGTRVRHQSAGGAIPVATATIHYRPTWQTNGEFSLNNEDVYQPTYSTSQPHTPNHNPSPHNNHVPSPLNNMQQQSPGQQQQQLQSFSYQVGNVPQSVPVTYRNSALDSEFVGDHNDDLDLLIQDEMEGVEEGKDRKEGGDELDLALSALRDCDTDFSKIFTDVENSTNN